MRSEYGPWIELTYFVGKATLEFVDIASMMEQRVIEMVEVVLQDLHC